MASLPITFTGPKGEPPEHHILRIEQAATITTEDVLYAGEILRSRIRQRTLAGLDVHGGPFIAYSPAYAKRKAARLGSSDVVNLFGYEHHPHMLNAMLVRAGGMELGPDDHAPAASANPQPVPATLLQVGFWNEEAATKAQVHNEGATIRTRLHTQMKLFTGSGRKARYGSNKASNFRMPKREFFDANAQDRELMERGIEERRLARLAAIDQGRG